MFASKPRYAPSATEVKNEFEWPLKGYWPAWDVLLRMPEEGYGPLGTYCPDEWELPFTIWEMKALAPGADDVRQTKSAHFGFKVPGRLFLCRRGFFCCCTSVCTSLWNRVSTLQLSIATERSLEHPRTSRIASCQARHLQRTNKILSGSGSTLQS